MIVRATRPRLARPPAVFTAWRRIVAWMVVTAIFAIGLATKSPEVHEHVHCDADHADHVCAITLAAIGYCDTAADTPQIAPDELTLDGAPVSPGSHLWSAPDYWLVPTHAPPPAVC